jgi:opacity protein-like surface antigen
MKRMLIVAGLSGVLMPALASAELDYDAFNAGFRTKASNISTGNYTEFGLGITKNIFKIAYLGASYETGTAPSTPSSAETVVHSTTLGAGLHFPLNDDVDIIIPGHAFQGTDIIPGSSASVNGYDVGAGIRALIPYGLEGSIVAVYENTSNDTYSNKDTYVNAQFGFDFTPEILMYAGIDLLRDHQTIDFGLRVYY